jgi:hypothetical protein
MSAWNVRPPHEHERRPNGPDNVVDICSFLTKLVPTCSRQQVPGSSGPDGPEGSRVESRIVGCKQAGARSRKIVPPNVVPLRYLRTRSGRTSPVVPYPALKELRNCVDVL